MGILVLVGLVGFAASLVNTMLGMGYGQISSTVLLGAGFAPAVVSGTVNLSKVVVGIVGGAAHWRFGNVDTRLAAQLALPGAVGAVVGVTVLTNVDGDGLRPYLAALLLVVGVRVLRRFSRPAAASGPETHSAPAADDTVGVGRVGAARTGEGADRRGAGVAALAGGVASGLIGIWGPLVTPVLLRRKSLEPRVVVGSVNAAEIVVALVAVTSLLGSVGRAGVDGGILGAMVVSGVVVAPVAAWAIRRVPARLLGLAVGVLLVVTNAHVLTGRIDLVGVRWSLFAVATLATLAAVAVPARRQRRTTAAAALTVS